MHSNEVIGVIEIQKDKVETRRPLVLKSHQGVMNFKIGSHNGSIPVLIWHDDNAKENIFWWFLGKQGIIWTQAQVFIRSVH